VNGSDRTTSTQRQNYFSFFDCHPKTERAAVNGSDRTTSMAQTREFDALTIRDLGACHDDDSINVQTHLKKSAQ
jgi:hypothetical protein